MPDLKEMTANIVAGYVAHAKIEADQLPSLIASVSSVLDGLGKPEATSEPVGGAAKLTPAQIRKSVADTGIVSFEDGKTYKSMKRHLSSRGLTPESYRAKWSLPNDYPIVAASYSAARSAMALKIGLGSKRRGAPVTVATSDPSPPVVVPSKAARGSKAALGAPESKSAAEAASTTVSASKAPRKSRPTKAISPSDDTFT